ncbi:MAG TPA: ABC transporter permease [Acidimicrobiales bacterium]|jgi:peptide/nickel transport system permease protein|nr:ABC transporter permease [Acidimicrobiales bacterium]
MAEPERDVAAEPLEPVTTLEPVDLDAATEILKPGAYERSAQARLGIGGRLAIVWLVLVVAAALLAPVLPLDDPNRSIAEIARQGPGTAGHVLGGDGLGRDLLSRMVWGARATLVLAVSSVGIGMVVGGALGLMAGYFKGRADTLLTGLFDVLLSFPGIILALTLVTVFASGAVSGGRRMVVLILALGVVSVPVLARISRASTLSWTQREFVMAAKAYGARNRSIMVREVLPNVLPAMFSIGLLGVAVVIVAEGALSILGIGVQLPTPSWGNIIAEGRTDLRNAPHIVFVPTIAIFLTVLALNYLGDIVRARFDVRESAL